VSKSSQSDHVTLIYGKGANLVWDFDLDWDFMASTVGMYLLYLWEKSEFEVLWREMCLLFKYRRVKKFVYWVVRGMELKIRL
jgi:hypothetical protein